MQSPTPEQYQPRLGPWSHAWRIGIVLAISSLGWFDVGVEQWRTARTLFWLDLSLGLLSFVAMFFRRRYPVQVATFTTLCGMASYSSAGPATLAIVSMATRRRLREIVPLSVLGIAITFVYTAYQPVPAQPMWLNFTFAVAVTIAIAAVGMYVGSRRELVWTLRDRALRAEAEQSNRLDQARSNERARIAREMHDVLAHRISLVAMHSGALAYRADLASEEIRESAALIQNQAHQALTDLRQVLGVLRDSEGQPLDRPQPTYADLPSLVAEAREAGMKVHFDTDLEDDVPESIGRTLYRVVQEGLTNVRKHAPHTEARVQVRGSDTEVSVTITNPRALGAHTAPVPGAGLGLVGLRERVELAGGRLDHGNGSDAFLLRASLPIS